MAEWSNAAVLKTVDLNGSGGSNPSLSAEKGVTDICSAFFNFSSPKVPQKSLFFRYLEVSGGMISKMVSPVFIPTTYLSFSDDPAFLNVSR